jgi:hypothetical protein
MSAQELHATLKRVTSLGNMDKGGGIAFKLRGALDSDLDALAATGSEAQQGVVKQILDTRAEYRRAMAAKEALAENEAYKLLGVDEKLTKGEQRRAAPTGSELLAKYDALSPERQIAVRKLM